LFYISLNTDLEWLTILVPDSQNVHFIINYRVLLLRTFCTVPKQLTDYIWVVPKSIKTRNTSRLNSRILTLNIHFYNSILDYVYCTSSLSGLYSSSDDESGSSSSVKWIFYKGKERKIVFVDFILNIICFEKDISIRFIWSIGILYDKRYMYM